MWFAIAGYEKKKPDQLLEQLIIKNKARKTMVRYFNWNFIYDTKLLDSKLRVWHVLLILDIVKVTHGYVKKGRAETLLSFLVSSRV